jgi:hypothetical protein
MAHFADDAVFESPRGPDPWGQRFVGHDEIRNAFAGRFSGIPDVRYEDDEHFVDGDRAASEWTLSGTPTNGQRIEVRGCDLWTLRDGMVVKKSLTPGVGSAWRLEDGVVGEVGHDLVEIVLVECRSDCADHPHPFVVVHLAPQSRHGSWSHL